MQDNDDGRTMTVLSDWESPPGDDVMVSQELADAMDSAAEEHDFCRKEALFWLMITQSLQDGSHQLRAHEKLTEWMALLNHSRDTMNALYERFRNEGAWL